MNGQRAVVVVAAVAALASCAQRDQAVPQRPPVNEQSCVDAWLAQHKLDEFGHPEGTAYAGGTPLFDEATGKTTDRLTYIYASHPEAKAACKGPAQ